MDKRLRRIESANAARYTDQADTLEQEEDFHEDVVHHRDAGVAVHTFPPSLSSEFSPAPESYDTSHKVVAEAGAILPQDHASLRPPRVELESWLESLSSPWTPQQDRPPPDARSNSVVERGPSSLGCALQRFLEDMSIKYQVTVLASSGDAESGSKIQTSCGEV